MTNAIEAIIITVLVTNTLTQYPKRFVQTEVPTQPLPYGGIISYPVMIGEWMEDTSSQVRRIVREVRRERTAQLEGKQLLLSSELLESDVRYQSLTWADTTNPAASNAFVCNSIWPVDGAANLVTTNNGLIFQSTNLTFTNITFELTPEVISNYLQSIKDK